MITGLDHIVLIVHDLEAAAERYGALFGLAPAWRTASDGAAGVIFTLDNISLEILAPRGEGATGDRVRAALDKDGEGLASLAFATTGLARLHRRLGNLGLTPEPIAEGLSHDLDTGAELSWSRSRATGPGANGLRAFFLQLNAPRPVSKATGPDPITAVERVIIRTHDADRAAAFYGARLGLEMRLDQAMGPARMMFFRCGDLTLEVLATPDAEPGRDRLWGLSWRGADMAAQHARIAAAGFSVSELREGRGAGTRIFTVRDGTCGIPTVVLQPAPAR